MRRRLPIVLLVVVAALQIVLAVRRDLTPWKGGGFGMFATVDSPSVRRLEVVAAGEGFRRSMDLSEVSLTARRRAMGYPSRDHLEDIAVRTAEEWPEGTRTVLVSVWSLEGDPHLPRLRRVLLGRETFRVLDDGSVTEP